MIELRWKIIAGGQKTLQYRQKYDKITRAQPAQPVNTMPFIVNFDFMSKTQEEIVWSDWQDVPDFYEPSDYCQSQVVA